MVSLAIGALPGCIDTALTLVVDITGGEAQVGADQLTIQVDCNVRVGTYALAGDDFTLPEASLFLGDTPIAEINLERPMDFDGRLEPGESRRVRVQGQVPLSAFPDAQRQLCGSTEATALVRWVADQQPDDPLDPPIRATGVAEGTVQVQCP